jgi:hypothetical protein
MSNHFHGGKGKVPPDNPTPAIRTKFDVEH